MEDVEQRMGQESFIQVVAALKQERRRQDEKWGVVNDGLAGTDRYKKLAILGEEFGEVATAILEQDYENLRQELIQVGAVAIAWLQSEQI